MSQRKSHLNDANLIERERKKLINSRKMFGKFFQNSSSLFKLIIYICFSQVYYSTVFVA
jgi:hypothetical protein